MSLRWLAMGALAIAACGAQAADVPENFDRLTAHAAPRALAKDAVVSEWPRLLGPRDNATSLETKLVSAFAKEGPKPVWEVAKGNGFGGPAIVGDRLVIFHRQDGQEVVECLHPENGRRYWNFAYAAPYRGRYGGSEGPRTSPVIDQGRVFTFGITGQLHAFDLATGKVLWKRDLQKELSMQPAFFGFGSTPLLQDGRLIVQVGGEAGGKPINCVALDPATGKTLWTCEHEWGASYASPTPAALYGRECTLIFAGGESRPPTGGLLVVDTKTGTVLGSAPHRADIAESVSATSPVLIPATNGKPARVFVSECYSAGGACFEIASDFTVRPLWNAERFDLYWMTPLVRDGCLFGFTGQSERLSELVCYEIETGKELWRSDLGGGFGRASLLAVDGRVLCLGEFGDLAWISLGRDGAKVDSRAKLFNAPETWTLPAVRHGLLYVSQNEQGARGTKPRLICYDLRAE